MVSRRAFLPLISLAALPLVPACSKTDATPKSEVDAPCASASVDALLTAIAHEENEKTALDTTAKRAPDRVNFRKVYEAETAFVAATEDRVAKLAACGASPAVLADVQARIAKARANLTYLRESFPDFK